MPRGPLQLRYPLDVGVMDRVITSPYGMRAFCATQPPPCFHKALDLRARTGTPILAPAKGVVTAAGILDSACGLGLKVDHEFKQDPMTGLRFSTLQTLYCHIVEIVVGVGQQVKKGQLLGYSGGNAGDYGAGSSKAAHLHFGVKVRASSHDKFASVDPEPHLWRALAGKKAVPWVAVGVGAGVLLVGGILYWRYRR